LTLSTPSSSSISSIEPYSPPRSSRNQPQILLFPPAPPPSILTHFLSETIGEIHVVVIVVVVAVVAIAVVIVVVIVLVVAVVVAVFIPFIPFSHFLSPILLLISLISLPKHFYPLRREL
jgi:hypothetical protein